ncbi:hypothetical protein [Woeseia oceani]|uniref:Uncharacterized protein n=1 Tax=Woeseia oceani TaxID=1548547 RepID=A0A193LEG6_9GAMM|nr:hypothetical protein [Woeseia oceani]ANO50846.1 hypothetical protein BA177_06165 [Woeseia oceani]
MNESEQQFDNDSWDSDRRSLDEIEETERLTTLYEEDSSDDASPDTEPPVAELEAAEPETAPTEDDAYEAYSPQEWATFSQFQQEVSQLRADEQRLATAQEAIKAAGGDIVKACGGDRERAAAVRSDLADLERSVRERQRGEKQAREQLSSHVESKRVASERKQLAKKVPELADAENRKQLGSWLLEQGFSAEDVSAIKPAQAAAAWKMMQANKPQGAEPGTRVRIPKRKTAGKSKKDEPRTVEEIFAAAGKPMARTVLYGPTIKKRTVRPPQAEVLTLLYGEAS